MYASVIMSRKGTEHESNETPAEVCEVDRRQAPQRLGHRTAPAQRKKYHKIHAGRHNIRDLAVTLLLMRNFERRLLQGKKDLSTRGKDGAGKAIDAAGKEINDNISNTIFSGAESLAPWGEQGL